MSFDVSALTPIIRNAEELIFEAELLFNANRFARSAALSVIAIEELGKFVSKKLDLDSKNQNFHRHKQHAAKVFISAGETLRQAMQWAEDNGYQLKHVSELSDWQKSWCEQNGRIGWESLEKGIESSLVEFYAQNHKLFDDVGQSRNECFYVDIAKDGTLKGCPSNVTSGTAARHLGLAKRTYAAVLKTYLADERPLGRA